MIRKMEEKDISDVLQIWLETNIKAHSFIDKEYWQKYMYMKRKKMVR